MHILYNMFKIYIVAVVYQFYTQVGLKLHFRSTPYYEKIYEYIIFGNAMEKHHFSRVKKVRGLNFIIAHRE